MQRVCLDCLDRPLPRRQGGWWGDSGARKEEVYVVITGVRKGGVDGGKLDGVTVLGEESLCLIHGGVIADHDTMVC